MSDSPVSARPEVTEGDRVEARNEPITLVDGRTAHLRFGAKALRHLERSYGGVNEWERAMKSQGDGPTASAVFDALIAGLLHLRMGTPEDVEDLLDENRLEEYVLAISRAMERHQAPEAQGLSNGNAAGTTGESPGATSTISSQSNVTALTTPFGT